MVDCFMSMAILKDAPVFEACIHRLLSTAKAALHVDRFRWIGDALWTLDLGRSLSNVAIISLNTFAHLKMRQWTLPQDCNVGIVSTRERAINPNNVTSQDTQRNLAQHP